MHKVRLTNRGQFCFTMMGMLFFSAFVAAGPSTAPATQASEELITLNFPDNLELRVLIEYVSQRLNINFLYDEQSVAQRVTLKTPAQVPKSSLLGLLESALRLKNLVLADAEQPGWKRIVPAANLMASATPSTQPASAGTAVIQVIPIQYADVAKIEQTIKPLLTPSAGSSSVVPEQKLLIVADYASNLRRVMDLIQILDQPQQETVTEFVAARNIDASQLATQVTQILTAKQKSLGATASASLIDSVVDARTNQVIFIGPRPRVDEAIRLAAELDVPLELQTKTYQFSSVSPDRMDRLVKEIIGPVEAKRSYQSVVDKESGMLIVTAPSSVHEKIASLKKDLDIPTTAAAQSPIRLYQLVNTTAADVLQTLIALEGDQGLSSSTTMENGAAPTSPPQPTQPPQPAPLMEGANRPPSAPGQPPYQPPIYQDNSSSTPGGAASPNGASQPRQTIKTARATITSDPNTNTIIVVAEPSVQSVYEQLIRTLDKRRPQVLIECTLVTLDTSNSFSLGVEIGGHGAADGTRFINFTSFGLSAVDANTGQLTLSPGAGFNGAVVNSDVATLILRALSTSGHAEVLSAPRILVNDNAQGILASNAEAPFTSINASNTVSTTSFAGYAQAGTTIAVTPHISEGDHLQLEYSVTLNNFTDKGSNGIPPPRQTDSVASKVTIPDGRTIIVGGLNRHNYSQSKTAIPLLGRIPILEYLFSSRGTDDHRTTLFVFLRPVILRDDQFEDLKFLSERDLQAAGLPQDFPSSEPLAFQ